LPEKSGLRIIGVPLSFMFMVELPAPPGFGTFGDGVGERNVASVQIGVAEVQMKLSFALQTTFNSAP